MRTSHATMNETQVKILTEAIRNARKAARLTTRDVADRTGIAHTTIVRLEQGTVSNPRLETIRVIVEAVGLNLNDLLAAMGYVQKGSLPTFRPYMRSKYKDMPPSAHAEMEAAFADIARKYGYHPGGPQPGEDEA